MITNAQVWLQRWSHDLSSSVAMTIMKDYFDREDDGMNEQFWSQRMLVNNLFYCNDGHSNKQAVRLQQSSHDHSINSINHHETPTIEVINCKVWSQWRSRWWLHNLSSLVITMIVNDRIDREDTCKWRSLIATMVAWAFKFGWDDDCEWFSWTRRWSRTRSSTAMRVARCRKVYGSWRFYGLFSLQYLNTKMF